MNEWAKESGLSASTIKRRYERGIRGKDLILNRRLNKKK